jgi:murein DD-endopeptidase MepM/ murein hydrolase activator NlpD
MLQPRERWTDDGGTAEVVAFPAPARAFGRRAEKAPLQLVVDLHAEEIGLKWFRGAATLAALCSAAIFLVPGFDPALPVAPKTPKVLHNVSLSDLAASQAPAEEPGAALPKPIGVEVGTSGKVKRISGDVTEGLYWSLRAAGASPQIAAEYLKAIATRIDVGEVAPFDRFDFAVEQGTVGQPDRLIYAGLDRAQYDDVRVLRWDDGGKVGWFDGSSAPQVSAGLMAPVAGHITSGFGYRYHPILHYSRLHAGIDFGASWGSPVVAAADGQVIGAGWAGGYGRQVRIAHAGGIVTSYSHMSGIAAGTGTPVRQGQVIGYVGSTGLSTGPHLHFEVRINGQPVNPLTARLVSRPAAAEGPQLAAFKARLKGLLAIPMKQVTAPAIATAAGSQEPFVHAPAG